jgi:eukaryotic-like serine/threonine-protein kinase
MVRPDSNVSGDDGNHALRLLRLVESFEDGWVAGCPIPLEDWLATAAAGALDRNELLRHGLAVEVAHRRCRGESPSAGDYLHRFPDRRSLIDEALAEARLRPGSDSSCESWPHRAGRVVEALNRSAGPMRRVLLGDTPGDSEEPVVRLWSPELPAPTASPPRLQLLGEIARGAMGAVLKGCDPDLGRDLAVKVLLEEHRHRPDLIRRFVEEAQIGGQLQHPGIVPVYELGIFDDARPYFTMKLVKGQTLTGLLAARTASSSELPRFLETFLRVAQTVAYAHARGVVHRDLKPSNVMVGSFGEVQVMDWGLAKVLPRGGTADDREVGEGAEPETAIATTRQDSELDRSRAGSVLGTPSYMAPEQADGQVEWVDERADVFALGSILCEILTGRPAYTGRSAEDVLRSARRADLAGAFARLKSCGADDELVRLARACLASARGDRLRDAQAVAQWMQAYLEGVHRRIREAEMARAAEAARAEEARATALAAEGRARAERRARRVTAGLAATVLIAVALGTVGWRWVELDRIRRRELISARVNAALQEATRLRGQAQTAATGDLTPWVEALAAADKAGGLLEPGCAPALRAQVQSLLADITADKQAAEAAIRSERADRAFMQRLVEIRSSNAKDDDGLQVDADYVRAFREAGLDVDAFLPAEAGARIRARPAAVAEAIVAALDHWALLRRSYRRDLPGARRLSELASAADPDPWRVGLRRALDLADWASRGRALQTLAAGANLDTMPAIDLHRLGTALADVGESQAAERVLRAGQRRFPDDLWLNLDLAFFLVAQSRDREAICFFLVGRALRPETALPLATLLANVGESDEAIAVFSDFLRRRPGNGLGWACYGGLLGEQGDRAGSAAALEKSVAISRERIRLRPDDHNAYYNLGMALHFQGKLAEAIDAHRSAVRLRPNLSLYYHSLGVSLNELRKGSDEAVAAFRTAIRLRPDYLNAHIDLGAALQERGELAAAVAAFRTAVRLQPDSAVSYFKLGVTLRLQGKLAESIAALRTAIRLRPNDAVAHLNLGHALQLRGELTEAATAFRTAIRLRPNYAAAHNNLGVTLQHQGQLAEAEAEFRAAIKIEPGLAEAHCALGRMLRAQGRFDEALAELRTGHRLGSSRPNWSSPSGQWVRDAERAVVLSRRLPAVLKGDDIPADPAEFLEFARICSQMRRHADAARLYADALRAEPKLADDRRAGHAYFAARNAALAGCGFGSEVPPPNEAARARLRGQALDWLRGELRTWSKTLDECKPEERGAIHQALEQWKTDPALAGLREPARLAKLPERERPAWPGLWGDLEALLTKALGDRP